MVAPPWSTLLDFTLERACGEKVAAKVVTFPTALMPYEPPAVLRPTTLVTSVTAIMSALTEWNSLAPATGNTRKQGSPLLYLLGFVFVLFIGILIFCYVVTRQANPVLLDPNGKPVTQSSESSHH